MRTGLDRLAGLLGRLSSLIARLVEGIGLGHTGPASEPQNATAPVCDFLTVSGVVLHYLDTGGSGLPLVLLHGNGGMIADMEISGLAELAAARYRVVIFDRPGYGLSQRPRAVAWTPERQADLLYRAMVALGIDRPVVLGHSWGALVALAMAVDHPDDVAGLVLASGYYFPSPRADVLFFTPPAIPVIGDIMRHTILIPLARAIAPALIRKIFAPQPTPPRFARSFPMDMALRPSQIRASADETMLMIPAAARLRKHYGAIRMPTFIIAGAADEVVDTAAQSVPLHAAIRDSALRILPGLGHMIHYFAADEIMAAIDQVAINTSGSTRRAAPAP
jgi:pimeloyl-ACP methyl ester carboxylesterase